MNNNSLFVKNYIKSPKLKGKSLKYFSKKFDKILLEIKSDIKNTKKTLNVLDKNFKLNFKTKNLKQFKKFKTIAIIGMGGSILGAEAIYNLFKKKIKKKVFFFNDLNENSLLNFKKNEDLSKVLFILISKSGNTIETLSNIFLLGMLRKNTKNVIIISEKKNNLLFSISKKLNLFHVEHRKYIGGRYSVLSEVGVLPAYLMGLNILKLRSKILNCLEKRNQIFLKNSTLKLANIMKTKKCNNLILLNYFPELNKFLEWCQQLIAESLGKKNKGFLPVISSVPKDHHSLLQLYLDGPNDKIFYVFSSELKSNLKIKISKNIVVDNVLNKKKLSEVKNAQKKSLIRSFVKKNILFRDLKIKKVNEEALGNLFSFFIIETVIVGKLLNINPFDQPAVEQVKAYTKKYLT